MATQRLRISLPAPKRRNKQLNDLLITKSKRGGPHKDKRKKVLKNELRKLLSGQGEEQ